MFSFSAEPIFFLVVKETDFIENFFQFCLLHTHPDAEFIQRISGVAQLGVHIAQQDHAPASNPGAQRLQVFTQAVGLRGEVRFGSIALGPHPGGNNLPDGSEVLTRRGSFVLFVWMILFAWAVLLSKDMTSTFIYFQF